ncbi:bifunctional DNA-formamidopyrimidine glycosylase/DNA-(apurinic or apyrimidinic site) lyase [Rhodococcus sp. IEGM 1408]|uniref:bifunctional DNA-formamidopyrimidine glycosylase/DNA-(apurinic or apyrimidinic site) lyase n=1 Tax=Rhodococcus sp. IEGM 1408 TaxID=3082220 RepID=UPI00295448F4|nr:bifunctional DNA-formamidopyrimidine glycosylase/DNA-(apurinic or apyrimidinic site) lyase [Rhodococcus sp. IEGM 1408]MDV8000476.1 bifunctional DNA-formamidopyrimidine glycosylase/DNA-(apurinic or apyrimidinic site) lyase [Rhodococcus sp. IEGM 1408]
MPELPEVEVVRRGLESHVVGRGITRVEVTGARTARRQPGGPTEIVDRLRGRVVTGAQRRGKYLWLTFDGDHTAGADCLLVHLGMSGQMLVTTADAPPVRHMHARAVLDDGNELRFVDQRTFGGWTVVPLAEALDGTGVLLPASAAHVAADPFEPGFDALATARAIRRRDTEIKRLLLDQTVVSGIGNIYADEALWRSGIHGRRRAGALTLTAVAGVLDHARSVMSDALDAGGTSFDALYVNVNGASGYFDRSLDVYGRAGEPCSRCGTAVVREDFMNRGSHFCPVCQVPPRRSGARAGGRSVPGRSLPGRSVR